jgi:hypothetical protein
MPTAPHGANVYHASSVAQSQQPNMNGHSSEEDNDTLISHWVCSSIIIQPLF